MLAGATEWRGRDEVPQGGREEHTHGGGGGGRGERERERERERKRWDEAIRKEMVTVVTD